MTSPPPSPSWALQQAVFAALSADNAVCAFVAARIFDAVPPAAPLPYLVLGEAEEADESATLGAATRHRLALHVWSRAGGTRELKQIAAAVRTCLDGAPLTLSGHNLADLSFVSAGYTRQNDGRTFRAVLRFTALTEPF